MKNRDGVRTDNGSVDKVFAMLHQTLSVQALALEHLVKLGEAKTEAILADQPQELEVIADSEMKAVEELQQAEQQRSQLVEWLEAQIARQVGHDVRLTLSNLIALAPDDWKDQFKTLEQRLKKATARLEQLSDLNRRLLAHSLAVVNLSLDVLVGNEGNSPTYGRTGKSGRVPDGARLVDAEA